MIEIEHLCKSYGPVQAVRDVSFRVQAGDIVGFLGPNGAGKTTTMRIVAGYLAPSSGRVQVGGHDVAEDRDRARATMGYMPEGCPGYPEMRAAEYLRFRAELKGVSRKQRRGEVERTLDIAGAADMADVRLGHLSRGYRQRVGLADALLGAPPLLVLDEPSAGLDPNQIREVRSLLRSLVPKHTVLLSTHILSEVEATCDRAVVIARGEVVAEGTIEELRRQRRQALRLELDVRGDRSTALDLVRAERGVESAAAMLLDDGQSHRITVELARGPADDDGAARIAEGLTTRLVGAGLRLSRLSPVGDSLEQVFSELTQEDHGATGGSAPPPASEPDPAPEGSGTDPGEERSP